MSTPFADMSDGVTFQACRKLGVFWELRVTRTETYMHVVGAKVCIEVRRLTTALRFFDQEALSGAEQRQ